MARVSFLMSIYNGAQYLAETMQSILTQDFDDYDILIIDDGSSDNFQDIVDRFSSKKIRIHSHSNRGLVESLNAGLELLDCKYVARADADDIYYPHRLKTQIENMEFAGLDAISNRVININEHGHVIDLNMPPRDFWKTDPNYFPAREPYLPHPFLTARLDVMREIGGYRHAHLSEDADLYWRLWRKHKMLVHEEPLGKYRIHGGSISSSALNRGRVQAYYSQLAALNFQRVNKSETEITYLPSLFDEVVKATSIYALHSSYADKMSKAESNWIMAATSAKLIDMAGWRNYRLSEIDYKEVILHLSKVKITDHENRMKIREQLVRARARNGEKIWDGADETPSFIEKIWNKRPIR